LAVLEANMPHSNKRKSILLDSEISDLYNPPILSSEQRRIYFTLNDVELNVFHSLNDKHSQIYFVLLLGYFKFKPVILEFGFSQIKEDFNSVKQVYFPEKKLKQRNLSRSQKSRLYQRIFTLTNYQIFSDEIRKRLEEKAQLIALVNFDSRYIFDECVDYLVSQNTAIPKYYFLQRTIISAMNKEKLRINIAIKTEVPNSLLIFMSNLLKAGSQITIRDIRQSAKNFTPKELSKEISVFNLLKPNMCQIDLVVSSLNISQNNIAYYGSLVSYYTVAKLKRFDKLTAYLYLLCFLKTRYQELNEHLADAFFYHSRKLKEDGRLYAKDAAFNEWKKAEQDVEKTSDLLYFFIDDSISDSTPFSDVKSEVFKLIDKNDLASLCRYLTDSKRPLEFYCWDYYEQQNSFITGTLRQLFLALSFEASNKTKMMVDQIDATQLAFNTNCIPTIHNKKLFKPSQLTHIVKDGIVDKFRYEMQLYLLVQSKLNGQLFIPNTQKYRCLSDDLVNNEDWKRKTELIKSTGIEKLSTPPKKLISTLENELHHKMEIVSQRIQSGDNRNVIMRSRSGKTKWRLPYKSKSSILNNPFFEQLKQAHVADILRFTHQKTGFLNAFEHIRNPSMNHNGIHHDLIASIIANGTNYGLYRMAHISDRSYEKLRLTQANHVRMETLNLANDIISNAISQLPIFSHYNIQEQGLHASTDGQKFECRIDSFKTRYSSKYFNTNKGVSAMTLVANHVPINAQVIGANEHESHFIFDLLFNNTSDIKPDILSTDTHGANHVNFALLDLFGYKFAPRYAQIGKVIDSLFMLSDNDGHNLLTLKKKINTNIIVKEWETIQRIIVSLKNKTTTQSAIVRKLSSYSKNHSLLQALTEYDRLIKSNYILEYIDDENLRSYVQRALNRGEAYHQLRRTVAAVNGNRFRGGSDGEIDLWNECARLLTNVIIYFNSLVLSRLLAHYIKQNDQQNIALIKQVSPVSWININLNGTYSFSFDDNVISMDEILSPITTK